ncbi:MAG: hypothetical protein WCG21_06530 [Eubacteriales bacterium]
MRKKTKQLNIRLTESEFARLTKNARKADLTMTCYLGMLINGYSPREKPDLDFIDLMSRLSDLAHCYRNLAAARRTSVSVDTIAIPSTAADTIEWQQQIEKLTRIIMEIQCAVLLPEREEIIWP